MKFLPFLQQRIQKLYQSRFSDPSVPYSQDPEPVTELVDPIARDTQSTSAPPSAYPSEKTIDDITTARANEVIQQLEEWLLPRIRKKSPDKKYRPVSIRLVDLGRLEDEARLCIVAQCHKQHSRLIKKIFAKDPVRKLCQPNHGNLPSFETMVCDELPTMKHDFDVFLPTESDTSDTYCGTPIIIRKPSGIESKCTFGGIIQATWSDGAIKLYGLTVHHPLLD